MRNDYGEEIEESWVSRVIGFFLNDAIDWLLNPFFWFAVSTWAAFIWLVYALYLR